MKKTCPICENEFNGRKEQICCSQKCASKWRSSTMKGNVVHVPFVDNKKTCPICGDMFIAKRRTQKTCSIKCGHKLQAKNISGLNNGLYNPKLKARLCAHCGICFRPTSVCEKGKFCSKYCKDLDQMRQIELICEECGSLFSLAKNRAEKYPSRYCSRACYFKNCNKRSYKVDYIINVLKTVIDSLEEEVTFGWLKTPKGYNMYLDLFIPMLNIAIEYDGEQHFGKSLGYSNEASVEYRQYLDRLKDSLCTKNNIRMIRFAYYENLSHEYILNKVGLVV